MTRPRRSTLIRQARQASNAAKRCEIISRNKKPGIAPGILNFSATETPKNVPVAKPITPRNGATGNEFVR